MRIKKFKEESTVVGFRIPKSKIEHFKKQVKPIIKKYEITNRTITPKSNLYLV